LFKVDRLEIPYRNVLICDGPEAGEVVKVPESAIHYSVFCGYENSWLATYEIIDQSPQSFGFLVEVEVYV